MARGKHQGNWVNDAHVAQALFNSWCLSHVICSEPEMCLLCSAEKFKGNGFAFFVYLARKVTLIFTDLSLMGNLCIVNLLCALPVLELYGLFVLESLLH